MSLSNYSLKTSVHVNFMVLATLVHKDIQYMALYSCIALHMLTFYSHVEKTSDDVTSFQEGQKQQQNNQLFK